MEAREHHWARGEKSTGSKTKDNPCNRGGPSNNRGDNTGCTQAVVTSLGVKGFSKRSSLPRPPSAGGCGGGTNHLSENSVETAVRSGFIDGRASSSSTFLVGPPPCSGRLCGGGKWERFLRQTTLLNTSSRPLNPTVAGGRLAENPGEVAHRITAEAKDVAEKRSVEP